MVIVNVDVLVLWDYGFFFEFGYFGYVFVDYGLLDIKFFGKLFFEVF